MRALEFGYFIFHPLPVEPLQSQEAGFARAREPPTAALILRPSHAMLCSRRCFSRPWHRRTIGGKQIRPALQADLLARGDEVEALWRRHRVGIRDAIRRRVIR